MRCYFITDPICRPYKNTGWMELVEDWAFCVNGIWYWIPAGYVFDGASIPRAFWFIIGSPFDPLFWAAALAHDFIYLTHLLSRAIADDIFRCFLKTKNVGIVKSQTMYVAVRTFAGFAWKNNVGDIIEIKKIVQLLRARPDRERFHFSDLSTAAI